MVGLPLIPRFILYLLRVLKKPLGAAIGERQRKPVGECARQSGILIVATILLIMLYIRFLEQGCLSEG